MSRFYCNGATGNVVECPLWDKCKHYAVEPDGSEEPGVIFMPSDIYNGDWSEDDFPCQMYEPKEN